MTSWEDTVKFAHLLFWKRCEICKLWTSCDETCTEIVFDVCQGGRASLEEPFSWIRDLMSKKLAEIEHYDQTSCISFGMGIFQRFLALSPAVFVFIGMAQV